MLLNFEILMNYILLFFALLFSWEINASFFNIDTGIGKCRTKGPFARCTSPEGALKCIAYKNQPLYEHIMALASQGSARFSVQGILKDGFTRQEATLVISAENKSQRGIAFTTQDVNCMSNLNGVKADMSTGHLSFNNENFSPTDTKGLLHTPEIEIALCRTKGPGAKCETPEASLRCMISKNRDKYNAFMAEMQAGGVRFSLSPIQDGDGLFGKRAILTGQPLSDSDKQSIIFETDDPNCMNNLAGKTGFVDEKTNIVFE